MKVPQGLKHVGVLLEPTTVVEKGIAQAYEIQRRLRVWRPRRAAVMGAGTIGLLATLVLRLRGLEVTTCGLTPKPYLNSDLIEALGARYQCTRELSILEGAKNYGPYDLIFEATGASPVVFDSMQALGKNGVLVLSSVTGGDRTIESRSSLPGLTPKSGLPDLGIDLRNSGKPEFRCNPSFSQEDGCAGQARA